MAHNYSRRSLLAALWSIVGLLTVTSFVIAFIFAYASTKYDGKNSRNEGDDAYAQQGTVGAISVTSRAMVFAAVSIVNLVAAVQRHRFCPKLSPFVKSNSLPRFVNIFDTEMNRFGRQSYQVYWSSTAP